jgi:hypothetical protein
MNTTFNMTSATLTFDNENDLLTAINGYKYKLALWDLDQFIRNELKYNDKLTEQQYDYAEMLRDKLHEFINDYEITIE